LVSKMDRQQGVKGSGGRRKLKKIKKIITLKLWSSVAVVVMGLVARMMGLVTSIGTTDHDGAAGQGAKMTEHPTWWAPSWPSAQIAVGGEC